MSDIFISYSQADRACAHEAVALLETHGIGCRIAPRNISPSADWAAEIIDYVRTQLGEAPRAAESDRTTFARRCRPLPGAR